MSYIGAVNFENTALILLSAFFMLTTLAVSNLIYGKYCNFIRSKFVLRISGIIPFSLHPVEHSQPEKISSNPPSGQTLPYPSTGNSPV